MLSESNPVACVLRCHVQPGAQQDCLALLHELLEASDQIPGCVFASLVPPATAADPYQLVQRFATPDDLAQWNASPAHAAWRERLARAAPGAAHFHPIAGLRTWAAPLVPVVMPPKWKLTVVSWMGIFPLVTLCLGLIAPLLQTWPFIARIFVVTVLVVSLMSYVVMPRLVVWMAWWLRRK